MRSIFQEDIYVPGSLEQLNAGDMPIGYSFSLRIADVRGTHLSCVEDFAVVQNGERVPAELIRFCLNGKGFSPADFPDLAYEYWRIDQAARVCVLNGTALCDVAALSVSFGMRVPYTGRWGSCVVAPFRRELLREGKVVEQP